MQYFQLFNRRFRSFELHPLLKRTAVNVLNPVSFFLYIILFRVCTLKALFLNKCFI